MRGHRAPVADDRDIRAGAAHVHREQRRRAQHPAQHSGGRDPRGGTGQQRVDRHPRGFARGHHAAVRFRHQQPRARQASGEKALHLCDVSRHRAPRVGVEQRRRGALVLGLLRPDLMRQHDIHPGRGCRDRLCGLQFVRGVAVRVKEADGDRGGPGDLRGAGRLRHVLQPDRRRSTDPSASIRSSISYRRAAAGMSGAARVANRSVGRSRRRRATPRMSRNPRW